MKNLATALYIRTSTRDQVGGMESQLRTLTEYCKANGITDYSVFEDFGVSGAKASRPGLDRMMNEVREGKIKRVIVYSFSRYARSVSHLLKALEEFKERDIEFTSYTEKLNLNTSMGIAVFHILSSVAQLERDLLRERVANGLKNAKAKGVKLGRPKQRDSKMIRKLRASGLTYEKISEITGASSGAISAEIKIWKKELLEKKQVEEKEFMEEIKKEYEKNKQVEEIKKRVLVESEGIAINKDPQNKDETNSEEQDEPASLFW